MTSEDPQVFSTWKSRFATAQAPSESVVSVFEVTDVIRYRYLRDDAEDTCDKQSWDLLWLPTVIPALTWEQKPEGWHVCLAQPFEHLSSTGPSPEEAHSAMVRHLLDFAAWLKEPENEYWVSYLTEDV